MSDAYPPNEIDNVESPPNRNVVAPNSNAGEEQVSDREHEELDQHEGEGEPHEPPQRRLTFQHKGADLVRD
jgi:hypothetical protein